jgi:Xaa-Pro aminopeptidase
VKFIGVFLILLLPLFVSAQFSDPSPWPEIRKKRIATLLPSAMKAAKVDAWLVVCRENNNDPLADHVGCENAGQTAVFLFFHHQQTFHSMAFSPAGEATALKDNNLLDEVVPVERSASAIQTAADFIRGKNFSNIAINMSSKNAQADGISFTQYQQLTKALGETLTNKLTTSDEIIYQWLSIKLPEEIAIMGKAAAVTAQWQIEAYQQIIPGVTTDADVAQFLKAKMRDAGVGDAWAAAQNPNVN